MVDADATAAIQIDDRHSGSANLAKASNAPPYCQSHVEAGQQGVPTVASSFDTERTSTVMIKEYE